MYSMYVSMYVCMYVCLYLSMYVKICKVLENKVLIIDPLYVSVAQLLQHWYM